LPLSDRAKLGGDVLDERLVRRLDGAATECLCVCGAADGANDGGKIDPGAGSFCNLVRGRPTVVRGGGGRLRGFGAVAADIVVIMNDVSLMNLEKSEFVFFVII
jgi:hypothetical protein